MKHNPSSTREDSAAGRSERTQPKHETESAQNMVHEVEIGDQGNSCKDGSFMTSRIHTQRKQEPYFTEPQFSRGGTQIRRALKEETPRSSDSIQIQSRAARDNRSDESLYGFDAMSTAPGQDTRENRRILNSWKEIANYMGRGVRTVQRYEQAYKLPVRRPANKDRTSVMALREELDRWLSSSPTRPLGYVRPVLLMLDGRVAGALSDRRAALEHAQFNVLVAANVDEVLATADKFNVDGFVFDCQVGEELCHSLKHRFPKKPLFVMVPKSRMNGKSPRADHVIPDGDSSALVSAVLSAFGEPRAV